MPVWFQWVVFVAIMFNAVVWGWIAAISAKHDAPERVLLCRVSVVGAMCFAAIAALTLWFIAGGAK